MTLDDLQFGVLNVIRFGAAFLFWRLQFDYALDGLGKGVSRVRVTARAAGAALICAALLAGAGHVEGEYDDQTRATAAETSNTFFESLVFTLIVSGHAVAHARRKSAQVGRG